MRKMKLATKISTGFGLLIAIAIALGFIAVFQMNNVSGRSTLLAQEYVPLMQTATSIRNAASRLMQAMQGYRLTGDQKLFDQARAETKALQKAVGQGRELSKQAGGLKKLTAELNKIQGAMKDYHQAMTDTAGLVARLDKLRAELDKQATSYMESSYQFVKEQNQAFKKSLAVRQKRIGLATELVLLGNKVRVSNYKAQAQNDIALLKQAMNMLGGVKDLTEKLREITTDQKALTHVDTILGASLGYKMAMSSFLREFAKGEAASRITLDSYRKEMGENAASYIKGCNDFLTGQQAALTEDMTQGHARIGLASAVIDLGNATRVATYKAQALRQPKMMEKAEENFAQIAEKFVALRRLTHDKQSLKRIDEVASAARGYHKAMASLLMDWQELNKVGQQADRLGGRVLVACAGLAKDGMDNTVSTARIAMNALNEASLVVLIGLAVALGIGVLLAVFSTRSITKPINAVIAGLTEGASQVASAAGQVSTASQSLAQGSGEQAASLEETTSSMEEMGSMTRKNADNAGEADSLSKEANQVVEKANAAMGELTSSMEEITKAGEETGKIIKTIDEIAFQTNLLALNAAVEAARAGEAGAGFAVVADEVRNLAMRAAEAAKNTADLIEGTITKTKHGSELVTRTNEAFTEVASSTVKVGELVSEIAAASAEQAQGIDQVNKAMGEMDKVTQQNAANAEESAAASEELSAQAETMQGFVGDLVALVGSRGKGKRRRRRKGQEDLQGEEEETRYLPPPENRAHAAAGQEGGAPPEPKGKKPAEAKTLPLDDDPDFADF